MRAVGERYRTVSAEEKGRILDEFVTLTGYHRKHAIRVLNSHVCRLHDPEPGFLEIDLAVHCGESMAGSFTSTLVLDIASGWSECIAQVK